jgi:hypothetical protein
MRSGGHCGLTRWPRCEYTLRERPAHDALYKVRLTIQTFNYNVKFKVDNVPGQGANTRARQPKRQSGGSKVCVHLLHVSVTSNDSTANKVKGFRARAAHECARRKKRSWRKNFSVRIGHLNGWPRQKKVRIYGHKQSAMYQSLAVDSRGAC